MSTSPSQPPKPDAESQLRSQQLCLWPPWYKGPDASGSPLTQQPMIRSEGVSAAARPAGGSGVDNSGTLSLNVPANAKSTSGSTGRNPDTAAGSGENRASDTTATPDGWQAIPTSETGVEWKAKTE